MYALRRISIMNGRRFQRPAVSSTVGCPLRPGTVEVAIEGNLPLITTPPAAASAPTCCTQATIELKEDGQSKIWQKLYWGSKEYTLSYNRRTHVEGVFGNLKNPFTENISGGSFRITGLARVTLFLGIGAVALNVRQYHNWHQQYGLGDSAHPLLSPDSQTLLMHMTPEQYETFQQWRATQTFTLPDLPAA